MKVWIVGAEITKYSWDNCVDRWDEVPRLLGVYTNRATAEEIAEQFDGVVTEIETDTFLNDCRESTCDYECHGEKDIYECEKCKYAYDILNESGISII